MLADAQIELIRREELENLQLERLKKTVAWSYEKSIFYRRSFDKHGVAPDDVRELSDVGKLPFLTREELHRIDVFDFLTLPLSSVVRVSNFDGLTKFYTTGDIRNNVEMLIRSLIAANILRGSTASIAGDLSDSRILDLLYALESIGATVVLRGSEILNADITFKLAENFLSCKNFNLYAPPEIGHAGMIYRCEENNLHVQEDNFLIEVSDGELVITTLTAQAQPLIRLKTGLKAEIICEPCPCGRTFSRISII